MNCGVTIDEKQLLYTIHEYFEQTGRIQCLNALEEDLRDNLKPRVPEDLAFLRRLCLNGRWEDVVECVKAFESCEHSQDCLYEVYKQWYLETLSSMQSGVEGSRVKLLSSLLSRLKELTSSEKDYSTLLSLLDLPSVGTSPDYTSWSLYPTRMKIFHTIAQWMAKFIYPGLDPLTVLKPADPTDPVRAKLVQLVAKGLMYEKCEAIALSRCRGDKGEKGSEMFDLCGWMRQQPDSAFQIPPSSCQLTFHPRNTSTEPTPNQQSENMRTENTTKLNRKMASNSAQHTEHSVAATPQTVCGEEEKASHDPLPSDHVTSKVTDSVPASRNGEDDPITDEASTGVMKIAPEHTVPIATGERTAVEDVPDSANDTRIADSAASSKSNHTKLAGPAPDIIPMPHEVGSSIRVHGAHSKIRVLEEFEDNFIPSSPPSLPLLPQVKSGRDSSNPKPSGNRLHLHPSPPTSPVGMATPQCQREEETNDGGSPLLKARGRCDFGESTEDVSIEWPTATLLSQVKDTQVS